MLRALVVWITRAAFALAGLDLMAGVLGGAGFGPLFLQYHDKQKEAENGQSDHIWQHGIH